MNEMPMREWIITCPEQRWPAGLMSRERPRFCPMCGDHVEDIAHKMQQVEDDEDEN